MFKYFKFVDIFSSRDSDSYILQREADSVNFWLNTSKIGHVMRDNPSHGTTMLAGMWGLKVAMNRSLANSIVETMLNPNLSKNYTFKTYGNDQKFLTDYVYKSLVSNSVIHDAYSCRALNGTPWPTQRVGNCFVGSIWGCDEWGSIQECPEACRPKDHMDWTHC